MEWVHIVLLVIALPVYAYIVSRLVTHAYFKSYYTTFKFYQDKENK